MKYELEAWPRESWALGSDAAADLWRDKWAAKCSDLWRDIGMDDERAPGDGLIMWASDSRPKLTATELVELLSPLSMAFPGWSFVLTHLEQDDSEWLRELWEGGVRVRDFRPVETWPEWDEWRKSEPKPSMRGAVARAMRADWDGAAAELAQLPASEFWEWLRWVDAMHGAAALHGLLAAGKHGRGGGKVDSALTVVRMLRCRNVRLRDLLARLFEGLSD